MKIWRHRSSPEYFYMEGESGDYVLSLPIRDCDHPRYWKHNYLRKYPDLRSRYRELQQNEEELFLINWVAARFIPRNGSV